MGDLLILGLLKELGNIRDMENRILDRIYNIVRGYKVNGEKYSTGKKRRGE